MGNADTKLSYRQAILDLTSRTKPVPFDDEDFWHQFWHDNHIEAIQEVFSLFSAQEIRLLRDERPENLATLVYKAVEQMVRATDTLCNTSSQHKTVLTCVALLTRIMPYIFEDNDWKSFFWSNTSIGSSNNKRSFANSPIGAGTQLELMDTRPLAASLMTALTDLLFCPDFTVAPLDVKGNRFGAPDSPPEDLQSIDSCEYIWEAGVGCSTCSLSTPTYDHNRTELLRLLLTCFSESMYCTTHEVGHRPNKWIQYFTSVDCNTPGSAMMGGAPLKGQGNRHCLPLFTSLLNTVFAYNPNSVMPFNHLLFTDTKEPLVTVALQILICCLDHDFAQVASSNGACQDNLFINYISRVHREDDFEFLLKGFTCLLNNPLHQSYLPNSSKRVQFHQELLVLFWKVCDHNKKFMHYVLKTCDVLKILVPILYHLNDARADRSRVGLVHIGVFIILLLSGERNFGVRLNRPYSAMVPMDLPIFSGTHADLLVIVFHKLITTGHQRLQPLFDCLLTILVNVSPYLKTLSMVASAKILHLLESFSTPWFLFTNPTNHHLVFFLLEIFNNIVQYQFDGNSNLIYTIIKKRHIFHSLANLPTDYGSIQRSLSKSLSSSQTSGVIMGSPTPTSSPLSPHESQTALLGNHVSLSSTTGKRTGSLNSRRRPPLTRPMSLADENLTQAFFPAPASEPTTVGRGAGRSSASNPTSPHYAHSSVDNSVPYFPVPAANVSGHRIVRSRPFDESGLEDQFNRRSSSSPSSSTPTDAAQAKPFGTSSSDHSLINQSQLTSCNVNVTLAAVPQIDSMTERIAPSSSLDEEQPSLMTNARADISEFTEKPIEESDSAHEHGYTGHSGENYSSIQYNYSNQPDHYQIVKQSKRPLARPLTLSRQSSVASDKTSHSTTSTSANHSSAWSNTLADWVPTSEWIISWKTKLPLQTIMRMLQVLVPQVEKMCIEKGITDENEILKFLQHGTLVGLLPVPHPILIRKYQTNIGTTIWFRTYMWGVIYLRNSEPPIWYDTNVKLFEIQKN